MDTANTVAVIDNNGCKNEEHNAICVPLKDGTCLSVKLPAAQAEKADDDGDEYLPRQCVSEYLGTLVLVLVVVGSGIMAQNLSQDVGVQLIINSLATVGGLYNLILILGPVSGAHFNPIVSMVDVMAGDMDLVKFGSYVVCQVAGGISGAVTANIIFEYDFVLSEKDRFGYNLWISEVLSTILLILVIHGNLRNGTAESIPGAVSLLVGAGYFFTSSTIFANPAVTLGRMFSNSFAGIQPKSAGPFVCFQIIGATLGYGLVSFLYPKKEASSSEGQIRQTTVIDMNATEPA